MAYSETIPFTLVAGQRFSSCSDSWSCGSAKTTQKDRYGDLVVELDNGLPVNAVFYSPDVSECTDSLRRDCDLVATFKGKELDILIDNSSVLAQYRADPAASAEPTPTQDANELQNSTAPDTSDAPGKDSNLFTSPYFIFGVPLLLIALFLVFRKFRLPSPQSKKKTRSIGARQTEAYGQSLKNNTAHQASSAFTGDIGRQLAAIQAKISQLDAKVGNLETELIVMGQQIDLAKPKVSPVISNQPLQPSSVQISSPPRPLDISLIKDAVSTANYDLIKNFPHDFVTETLESRQGIEESVRFSIDGNQETSQQRAQSEFIAITYANETYLIPNILPNATDPARTIKRHVDRNKVYRGDGLNLLSLAEVATVERSGDSYILAKPGRVG